MKSRIAMGGILAGGAGEWNEGSGAESQRFLAEPWIICSADLLKL